MAGIATAVENRGGEQLLGSRHDSAFRLAYLAFGQGDGIRPAPLCRLLVVAEDVEDHVEVEAGPLRVPLELVPIPRPNPVGRGGHELGFRIDRPLARVATLSPPDPVQSPFSSPTFPRQEKLRKDPPRQILLILIPSGDPSHTRRYTQIRTKEYAVPGRSWLR